MSEPARLPDRWATRDFPILVEIARKLDEGERNVRATHIASIVDAKADEVIRAFEALVPAYLTGKPLDTLGGRLDFMVNGLTERGRRAVGLWPSGESVDALVDALRQAEEATDDPEEKSNIRRAMGAVVSVSRDVMVDVVAAVVAKQSGLG